MDFKASLDTLSKGLTTGIVILLIVIGQKSARALMAAHGDKTTTLIHGGTLLLFVVIIVGSYVYSTQYYTLTNDQLIINRPIGNKIFNLEDIVEVRSIESDELSATTRTFGSGGFFGYYGKFYNSKLKHMTWYVTQKQNRILIVTKRGAKIVISPDDISLLDKIKAARSGTSLN